VEILSEGGAKYFGGCKLPCPHPTENPSMLATGWYGNTRDAGTSCLIKIHF
jgi:hypothetical protein